MYLIPIATNWGVVGQCKEKNLLTSFNLARTQLIHSFMISTKAIPFVDIPANLIESADTATLKGLLTLFTPSFLLLACSCGLSNRHRLLTFSQNCEWKRGIPEEMQLCTAPLSSGQRGTRSIPGRRRPSPIPTKTLGASMQIAISFRSFVASPCCFIRVIYRLSRV